ncbi:MAG: hypothetical protein LBH59_05975 [Planctomycetaceae bacterium]|nr:hypothetical protein [Planctomycetaceae bacterium]
MERLFKGEAYRLYQLRYNSQYQQKYNSIFYTTTSNTTLTKIFLTIHGYIIFFWF